jgi:hypothetical protein
MSKQPYRYTLKHMLDVAHDYKVGAFLLRTALMAERSDSGMTKDAPLGSFVLVAVQHIEVCLKALHFAGTGQELQEPDVVELYKALSAAERAGLAQEFEWVRGRTGSKLDLAATVQMAGDSLGRVRHAYELADTERLLDVDSLRDLGAALDARIQALSGQTAQATRPLMDIKS